MAKGTVEKRPLTDEELADAKRLKDAWLLYKGEHGVTQEWLAEKTGLGNQSLMGQYLNGGIQLNAKAVLAFSRVLNIPPAAISPSMKFPRIGLSQDEEKLLNIFRAVTDDAKKNLLMMAEAYSKAYSSEQASISVPPKQGKSLRVHKL